MPEPLIMRLHNTVVGELRPGADRSRISMRIEPSYDPNGVTLTESFTALPGQQAPVEELSNLLGGYLPEGNHRTVMASRRGVDPGDLMALLREFGGSVAGAVTVLPASVSPTDASAGWVEKMSERVLADRLRQALNDTDQAVPDDSRSTLPGYQPKVVARRAGRGWGQPHGTAHSTHILKPQVPHRASRLIDEHYGHLLAQSAGLADYTSSLHVANDVVFLAIERYDRRTVPDGTVTLIHQEDAAQALGLNWRTADSKFEDPHRAGNPARPSTGRIARTLSDIPGSSAVLEQWVRRLVFSIMLGDNDAHAKNIALLHTESTTVLAPAYDTVPNLHQRDMIDEGFRLALSIDGTFDHREISADRIVAEVRSWKVVTPDRAATLVESAVNLCADAITRTPGPTGLSEGVIDKLAHTADRLTRGEAIGTSRWQSPARQGKPPSRTRPARPRAAGAAPSGNVSAR